MFKIKREMEMTLSRPSYYFYDPELIYDSSSEVQNYLSIRPRSNNVNKIKLFIHHNMDCSSDIFINCEVFPNTPWKKYTLLIEPNKIIKIGYKKTYEIINYKSV